MSSGCTFTVLVHTREAATRNMEKIQVMKVGEETDPTREPPQIAQL